MQSTLDSQGVFCVVVCCVPQGHFSEADTAVVMKQLLEFMIFMHAKNVVHR